MIEFSDVEYFRSLYQIRSFEETVLTAFSTGVFSGTTHAYLGQEANAVGVIQHIAENDVIFSNHRCHGHFLAYGGDAHKLFAEMMGKPTGVCGGIGGSQHLHYKNFYSNGILGGTIPIAVGVALAEKRKKNNAIIIAFLGDGALGEGIVYESLNMATIWNAPILFVVENNHIAQTTPTEKVMAGQIAARFTSFNIPCKELDSSDVLEIADIAQAQIRNVRSDSRPYGLILNTERFGPHSKGDDTRSREKVEQLKSTRDPIQIQGLRLAAEGMRAVIDSVDRQIQQAFEAAINDPVYPN